MKVTALKPFGVGIAEINCAEPESGLIRELQALLAEKELLLFPDQQHLSPQQEVAFHQLINPDCHSVWRDQENNPWERYKIEQGNKAGTYQIPGEPGVLVITATRAVSHGRLEGK